MCQIVMIIPPAQFRDEELFETRVVLEVAGHAVVVASTTTQPCTGMLGGRTTPALTLAEVQPEAFDAVVFVGGAGVQQFYHDERALQLARAMQARGKIVAAICLAPVVLANAGVLTGKQATVSRSEVATIQRHGAHYGGPGVVVDGTIVTGDGPQSARQFGRAIAALLSPVVV
ncbi:MAG: hypothetical protein HGA45_06235 [Chloroflexales bacterium]|nr:hypothetical protein [Chloroflexales bacterium]